MDLIVLDEIPFEINLDKLMRKMRVKDQSKHADALKQLADQALEAGRPRAVYGLARVEHQDDTTVLLDGEVFTSRILRVNLNQLHRVFPYIASCGPELDAWMNRQEGMLDRFYAESINELALRSAHDFMIKHIKANYHPHKLSFMSPGSLPDWPIKQQRPLFRIFGNEDNPAQVHLTKSMLMVPTKSVSGIAFPSEEGFFSCQLCPMEDCPGRRAPHTPEMQEKYE